MSKKANAKQKLDIDALQRRKNGQKEQPVSDALTEGEKTQVVIMMERLNLLETQLQQIRMATSELITSIVTLRGLDPKRYGVNLAAGRILPVGPPPLPQSAQEREEKEE